MSSLSQEVISRFNLKRDSYYTKSAYGRPEEDALTERIKNAKLEQLLREKWGHKIEKGHYGFSLSSPLPTVFFEAIDYLLEKLDERCPNFTFSQIKLKMGSVRFYLNGIDTETDYEVEAIAQELHDKYLFY